MVEVVPAILAEDFRAVREKIDQIGELTSWLHLDIADGVFVDSYTWQTPDDLKTIDGKIKIEVHLMVEHPEQHLKDWLYVADRVIIHPESTDRLEKIVRDFGAGQVKLGLALLLPTSLEVIEPFLDQIDLVQLMSIERLGFHGEPFDARVIERIRTLRQAHPGVTISVDGGVNLQTAGTLVAAGANRLVVGSGIWQSPDPLAAIETLRNLSAVPRSS